MAGPLVALVVCGAPLAARMHEIAAAFVAVDWSVSPLATADALPWIDIPQVEFVTGREVRTAQRKPGTGSRSGLPDVAVVCPATFNTINKLAAGTADTYVTTSLCEWLGARVPIVLVPMVNDQLWRHPAWLPGLSVLCAARVVQLDIHSGAAGSRPVVSGSGDDVVQHFNPQWIIDIVRTMSR